ncbi:MAG TPA: hypothetical protein VK658_23250 [Chryseolinea sp.]|nr:hypothetical protein [Chryseolinea sp.]
MKYLFAFSLFCVASSKIAFAQWNVSGDNIYSSNSGYVGIGTSNFTTNRKLVVAAGDDWQIGLSNISAGGSEWMIGSSGAAWECGGGKFVITNDFWSGNASLTIDSDKNVGIGTVSPLAKLHLAGNLIVDSSSPTLFTSSSGSDQNRFLHLRNSPALNAASGLKAGGLLVADNFDYASPGKNDMIVKGSVGIGTALLSNPNGYSLYVNGKLNANAVYVNNDLLVSSQWKTTAEKIYYDGTVGIGTLLQSNPNNYKLAINGKVGAHEVRVEQSSEAWPDYVFNDEYQLSTLAEVEQFIKLNKHLKDVPSQTDVSSSGHDLGSMDAVLLRKIEELTLYIIQLERRLESHQNEISALKSTAVSKTTTVSEVR